MELRSRLASRSDLSWLEPLVTRAIDELQRGLVDAEQITASHAIMGIDTQLVDDGTYYVVELGGALAGCGGWSRRATLYGATTRSAETNTCSTPLSMRPAYERCTPIQPSPGEVWAG